MELPGKFAMLLWKVFPMSTECHGNKLEQDLNREWFCFNMVFPDQNCDVNASLNLLFLKRNCSLPSRFLKSDFPFEIRNKISDF